MATVPRPTRSRATPVAKAGQLTLVTDGFRLVVPPNVHTLEGFRAWATADDFPERVRLTYLDGEVIIDMSNEEINTHVAPKTRLIATLGSLVDQRKLGHFYGSGVLLVNEEGLVSNNPDALFVSRASLVARRVRLVPRKGLEGTPDMVLEVVSDSSVQKDTVRLRDNYHRAGIPEYWLVDGRGEKVTFQILNHRKSGYAASPVRDGWQSSKVFCCSFRLERALDDFGLWDSTLHVRDE